MIIAYYLLLSALLLYIYKKLQGKALLWCLIYEALWAVEIFDGGDSAQILALLSLIFTLMVTVCVWGSNPALMIPFFALGVFIHPGFFLSAAPLILGVSSYQARIRPAAGLMGTAGILSGGAVLFIRLNTSLGFLSRVYGLLQTSDPYLSLHGFSGDGISKKLILLLIFLVLLSPFIALYIRLLGEVRWDARYVAFLPYGVLPVAGYLIQDGWRWAIYYLPAYYMLAVMLPIIWKDAIWIFPINKLKSKMASTPIGIILVGYAIFLFLFGWRFLCAII